MRIQTNIQAANAFRNYNKNTSALSKNLEKLSSGYRINRAGDDAAGLAISEKMRAQVTGLNAAGKNVKDGISLIKTAEGALQEVQDMMNRMTYLATQSANGTYDNEVDRANLQKEVEALKTEIDRIADSSNFNGQKLLNGELGSSAASSSTVKGDLTLAANLQGSSAGVEDYTAATKAESKLVLTALANGNKLAAGDTVTLSLTGNDNKVYDITLTVSDDKQSLVDADGNTMGSINDLGTDGITNVELATAFGKAIEGIDALNALYDVDTTTGGTIALKSKDAGADAASVKMTTLAVNAADTTVAANAVTKTVVDGKDAYESFDVGKYVTKVANGGGATGWDVADDDCLDAKDAVFEINGEKFAIVADQASAEALVKEMGSDVTTVIHTGDDETTATALKDAINLKTGLAAEVDGTNTDGINLKASTTTTAADKNDGMTLQIGDSAEEYNQMKLSICDTHAAALGLDDVDISTLEGAQSAIETIKNAINTVSATRGDLGAAQNRLEYTQNNLAIMKENFTDAESSIRDTDVADEMTQYTKNNILLQSAQAMLAQANQMPQGVLQLLQ